MLKRLIYLLFCSLLLAGCATGQETQQTDLIQLSNQTVLSDNYLFLYAEPIGYEKTVINEDHCIYQSDQGTIEIISRNEIANVQTDELDVSKEDLLRFANEQLGQAQSYEYALINSVPFLSLKYSDGKQYHHKDGLIYIFFLRYQGTMIRIRSIIFSWQSTFV